MLPRKRLTDFLSINNQSEATEQRLNHEAIALYLKHSLKLDKDQTFMLAGSEDLRALLPRLTLAAVGDEAFLLIRPYIHSMAIYCRYTNERLHVYIFDSQSWGTRYYPTRLMIDAIHQHYPNALIILSNTQLQPQDNQRGCTAYALNFIDFCKYNGEHLFKTDINSKLALNDYPNTFLDTENNLPAVLLETSMNNQPDWYNTFTEQVNNQLEDILHLYIEENQTLNLEKIHHDVKEMQGLFFERDTIPCCNNLYEISIDPISASITFSFRGKDFIYANLPVYSNALYASAVTHTIVTTRSEAKDHNTSTALLHDCDDIAISYNASTRELRYSAANIALLENAFLTLEREADNLFSKHVRQRLGLLNFVQEVKMHFAFHKICQNKTGGFDPQQIQLILAHEFKNHPEVYIPDIEKITGESASLPLVSLASSGYKYVAFTLPLRGEHQVAVLIELSEQGHHIAVYDSEASHSLTHDAIQYLAQLLNVEPHKIKQKQSPFANQTDGWSCGVHVIDILKHVYNASTLAATAAAPTPTELPVTTLGWQYYQTYLHQARLRELQGGIHQANEKAIREFLCLIEAVRFKQGFYANLHADPKDRLKPLADYLQRIVWGNLDRKSSPKDNRDREMQADSFWLSQSIQTICEQFALHYTENKALLNRIVEFYIMQMRDQVYANKLVMIEALIFLEEKHYQEKALKSPEQQSEDKAIHCMDILTTKLVIGQEITSFIDSHANAETAVTELLNTLFANMSKDPLLSCLTLIMLESDIAEKEASQQALDEYYRRMPMTHQYTLIHEILNHIHCYYRSPESNKRIENAILRAEQQAYLHASRVEESELNDFIAHMGQMGITISNSYLYSTTNIKKILRQAPAIKIYTNPIYFANMTAVETSSLLEDLFNSNKKLHLGSILKACPKQNKPSYYKWVIDNIDFVNEPNNDLIDCFLSALTKKRQFIKLLHKLAKNPIQSDLTNNARTLLASYDAVNNPLKFKALLCTPKQLNFALQPNILILLKNKDITLSSIRSIEDERLTLLQSQNLERLFINKEYFTRFLQLHVDHLIQLDNPFASIIISERLLPFTSFIVNLELNEPYLNNEAIEFLRKRILPLEVLESYLFRCRSELAIPDLINYANKFKNTLPILFSAIRNKYRDSTWDNRANLFDTQLTLSMSEDSYIKSVLRNLECLITYIPDDYISTFRPEEVLVFIDKLRHYKASYQRIARLSDVIQLFSDSAHYLNKLITTFNVNNRSLLKEILGILNHNQFCTVLEKVRLESNNINDINRANFILDNINADLFQNGHLSPSRRRHLLLHTYERHVMTFLLLPNRYNSLTDDEQVDAANPETLRLLSRPELDGLFSSRFFTTALSMSVSMLKLYIALKLNKLDEINTLVMNNSDINECTSSGMTLLYFAVIENNLAAAQLMINLGASVNAPTPAERMSVLWRAIFYGKIGMAELLIVNGADVNSIYFDLTPLMTAVKSQNNQLIKILLENQARVNAINCYGLTALDYAVRKNDTQTLRILLSHGAKIPYRDSNDSLALENCNEEILELLIQHGCTPAAPSPLHTNMHTMWRPAAITRRQSDDAHEHSSYSMNSCRLV